jgi:hypothetical protein
VTYHDHLVAYLAYCPGTAVIAVPTGNLAAAGTIPDVIIVEHDAYYNEYRAADGSALARVVFPD